MLLCVSSEHTLNSLGVSFFVTILFSRACSRQKLVTCLFQAVLNWLKKPTSSGCVMWVVFGYNVYRIIPTLRQKWPAWNDTWDLWLSTNKATGSGKSSLKEGKTTFHSYWHNLINSDWWLDFERNMQICARNIVTLPTVFRRSLTLNFNLLTMFSFQLYLGIFFLSNSKFFLLGFLAS